MCLGAHVGKARCHRVAPTLTWHLGDVRCVRVGLEVSPLELSFQLQRHWQMSEMELKRRQLTEETIMELQGVLGQASDGNWRDIQSWRLLI